MVMPWDRSRPSGGRWSYGNITVQHWVMPPVPDVLAVLSERVDLRRVRGDGYERQGGEGMPVTEPDLIVVLDTGAWSQLDPIRMYLELRREKVIVIDHHQHGDDVGRDAVCRTPTPRRPARSLPNSLTS